jgi:kumamolisin
MEIRTTNLVRIDIKDPDTGQIPAAIPFSGYLTGPQIAKAYNIPNGTGKGVKIGIISAGGGGFLQSDLDKSFTDLKNAGLIASNIQTPIIRQVLLDGADGSFSPSDGASGENTVDIFCAATVAPQADITIYIGNSFESPINQAIADGCHILNISWATYEGTFLESILSSAVSNKIAVCVASGDWGSGIAYNYATLEPCYPSSSPYAISVGGTKLILNVDNTRLSETDDNRDVNFGSGWGGGGGVSVIFPLPSWQSNLFYTPIVRGVIESPTPLTMRGLPDLSAPMNVYVLYFNGSIAGFGGTSLASPIVAGILARLQQLTGVQRSSVDYNTLFYSNQSAFFDITVGTNNTQLSSGYAGTVGWDAVTGLGPMKGNDFYKKIHTGTTFPKLNGTLRPAFGQTYPRPQTIR